MTVRGKGVGRALLEGAAHLSRNTRKSAQKSYKFVIFLLQRMLRICNLARHVHKAQRHMAIFDTVTITQQPSVAPGHGNIDSAVHGKSIE